MVKFVWTKEHEKCFTEIKKRLCEYPVLHLPTMTGRFILYSDTSRQHAGSAMWQMQNGQPELIGYSSKTLPKACLNCHVCQFLKAGPRFDRPYQKRININVPALTKISMDIKYMPATPDCSGKP